MPTCFQCNEYYETNIELAQHILGKKKHPRKSIQWAQHLILMEKRKPEGFTPLTDEQKQARRDARIELSGRNEIVRTFCMRGKHFVTQSLPVEYVASETAWRIQGKLVVMCESCRG